MRKLFISVLAVGVVLVSGLVSCAKEKTNIETDVYSGPEPRIFGQHQSQTLSQFESQENRELDLRDAIDFESKPERVLLRLKCAGISDQIRVFEKTRRVEVSQVIDPTLLTQDLNKDPKICNLTLQLENAIGSKRIYQVVALKLVDKRTDEVVQIAREAVNLTGRFSVSPLEIGGIKVRVSNPANAEAQVICNKNKSVVVSFRQVVDLSSFDLVSAAWSEKSATGKPNQDCRVAVQIDGFTHYSSLFELRPARSTLEVKIKDIWPAASIESPHAIALYTVTNTSNTPRTVHFPTNFIPGSFYIVESRSYFKANYAFVRIEFEHFEPKHEMPMSKLIPPKTTIVVRVHFDKNNMPCGGFGPSTAYGIEAGNFQGFELDEVGAVVGMAHFPQLPITWSVKPAPQYQRMPQIQTCPGQPGRS